MAAITTGQSSIRCWRDPSLRRRADETGPAGVHLRSQKKPRRRLIMTDARKHAPESRALLGWQGLATFRTVTCYGPVMALAVAAAMPTAATAQQPSPVASALVFDSVTVIDV